MREQVLFAAGGIEVVRDILIIGGGVVGCAVARELSAYQADAMYTSTYANRSPSNVLKTPESSPSASVLVNATRKRLMNWRQCKHMRLLTSGSHSF